MPFRFNPFTGNLDLVDTTTAAGSNTQIQFNDSGSLAGDVDLTWNKTTNVMTVAGDVNLSDGGSFTTTLQTITPTANRTVSIPDATGTLALVAGSSGQLLYNNAGANAGVSTFTADSSGRLTNSASSASGFPVKLWNGTIFAGTTPHVLIQPSTASPGSWSASGTALGVNAASVFAGRLLDLQLNGTSNFNVSSTGALAAVNGSAGINNSGFIGGWSLGAIGFTNAATWSAGATLDVLLRRDAANTLALRNDTSAQVFRVYNTYTSSTNYELGKLEWSGNAFRIGTEKGSGGGTARGLEFQVDGTTRVSIDTAGTLVIGPGTGLQIAGASGSAAKTIQSYDSAPLALNSLGNNVGIGTSSPTAVLDVNSNTLRLRTARTPASATATGNAGDICWDADYIYVCTATNTWKRAALATW